MQQCSQDCKENQVLMQQSGCAVTTALVPSEPSWLQLVFVEVLLTVTVAASVS